MPGAAAGAQRAVLFETLGKAAQQKDWDSWTAELRKAGHPVSLRRGRGDEGVLEAARESSLLVIGLSDRWRREGLGATRLAVARKASVPTLIVRRGLRPGGLAPRESLTRFTWSLTD